MELVKDKSDGIALDLWCFRIMINENVAEGKVNAWTQRDS